jgi:hypothetical protein
MICVASTARYQLQWLVQINDRNTQISMPNKNPDVSIQFVGKFESNSKYKN